LGFINSLVRGNLVRDVRKLHEKYGDIVRLAPDELSFAREDAWHDVFSKRAGHQQFLKNPVFFKAPPGQPENMVTTINTEDHARMRRLLAPAFTEQALMKQEPIVQSHANLLIHQLKGLIEARQNPMERTMEPYANFRSHSFRCLVNLQDSLSFFVVPDLLRHSEEESQSFKVPN
jgi:cytochrome P450